MMKTADPLEVAKRFEKSRKHPKIIGGAKINSPTKQKAQQLLKQEKQNALESRLECLLSQQFQAKYGSRHPTSDLNVIIRKTIHDFLHQHPNLKEGSALIDTLEHEIRERTTDHKRKLSEVRANELAQSRELSMKPSIATNNSSSVKVEEEAPEFDKSQWSVLNAMQALKMKEQDEEKKRIAEQRRLKFKVELDAQVALNESLKRKEIEDAKKYQEEVKRMDELAKQKAALEKERRALKLSKDRDNIMKQMEDRQHQRDAEYQQGIMEAHRERLRAEQLKREEEELIRMRKEKQQRQRDELIAENERVKSVKAELKRQEREQAEKQEREYKEKLQREDRMRQEVFQARMDAIQKKSDFYANQAGASLAAQARKEEERTLAEMEAKNRAVEEAERRKQMERQKKIDAAAADNYRVMKEKEMKKAQAKQDSNDLRLQFKREYEESRQSELEKKRRQKEKAEELKRALDEQIAQKHDKTAESRNGLTERELEMNKSMLAAIEQDPKLQKQIYEKIHPQGHARKPTSFTLA